MLNVSNSETTVLLLAICFSTYQYLLHNNRFDDSKNWKFDDGAKVKIAPLVSIATCLTAKLNLK